MKTIRWIRFSREECFAIALASLLTVIGLWLALKFDGEWLNRFGALIAIVGVIFGFNDLPDLMDKRAKEFANLRAVFKAQSEINSIDEETHIDMTQHQKDTIRRDVNRRLKPDFEAEASIPKKRFLIVEAAIICYGTFLHGFGEWLTSQLAPFL